MAKVAPKERTEKPREKKKKRGRYKLKLNGFLKTPADWARFNEWAKVNSLPRKIPEPEPVTRASKPLWKMRKRIEILSKPRKKTDPSLHYRLDQSVSKNALKAKASKRIKIISKPIVKSVLMPREFPVKIPKSTLNYKATENIIKISKPKDFRSEKCKNLAEVLETMELEMDEMSKKEREKHEELWRNVIKKAMACPNVLNTDQIRQLITEGGVHKTAFSYKFTPWMEFLSLPSYKLLRIRKDENAKKMKEYYLNEMETRGRRALEEQFEREEKRRKLEEEIVDDDDGDEQNGETLDIEPEVEEKVEEDVVKEEIGEQPVDESENIEEEMAEKESEPVEKAEENNKEEKAEKKEKLTKGEKPEKKEKLPIKSEDKSKQTRFIPRPTPPADDEDSKKKRAERNAWRFEPPPWKDGDLGKVKESALKGPVSRRFRELAKPPVRKDTVSRKNPFNVKKSALTSPVPQRVTNLAKPARPRDPIERPPSRKKNKYGQPILPMPEYGKKLPRVPKYKEKECKKGDEESPETPQDDEKPKKVDPIVFKPTIDPYFFPEDAERQLNARNDLAAMNKNKEQI